MVNGIGIWDCSMQKCGIYGIFNTANEKVLVGSSSNIRVRWKNHKVKARRGTHENSYFQAAWNKYGESAFEFRILVELSEKPQML